MEKKKVFYQRLKIVLLLILAVIIFLSLGIAGPYAIDKAYDWPCKIFFTSWESSDVLAYYGTLLGASATIFAVILTIRFANKNNQDNKKHTEKINNRSIGVPICIELINSCDPMKVFAIIEELQHERYTKNNDAENIRKNTASKFDRISNDIRAASIKFQILYNEINDKRIITYIDQYYRTIDTIKYSMVIKEERVEFSADPYEQILVYELRKENDEDSAYEKFLDRIRAEILG